MRLFILLLLLSPFCQADDSIMECVERGRMSLSVGKAIAEEGYQPDQINFAFPLAKPEDLEAAQAWGEALKAEVIFALAEKGTAELAAQAIMERCAYEYGKSHSNMKKTHEVTKEYQYCYAYIKQLRAIFKDVKYSAAMATLVDYLVRDEAHDTAEIKALTEMVVKEMLTKHPPESENYDTARAAALVREIVGVDTPPQEWIEKKWNACIGNP